MGNNLIYVKVRGEISLVLCSFLSRVQLLWPHGLWPTRLLCPWDPPGKNAGVGSYSLLQGIILTQRLNPGLPHCRQILYQLNYQGSLSKERYSTQTVKRLSIMWETWVRSLGWEDSLEKGKATWCEEASLVTPGCDERKYSVYCRVPRLPTPVFWPGEFHGPYSPSGCKESYTTEWLSLHKAIWL